MAAFDPAKHPRSENGRFAKKGERAKAKGSSSAASAGSGGKTARLRKRLKQKLSPYFNKPIHNRHSNVSAYISGNSVNKIASDKAIGKSKVNGFSVEQHFEIAGRIVPLFRNSRLEETRSDRGNSPNILSIKRFAMPAKLSSGRRTKVWITVKETKIEGHRIYSIELMEIKKAPASGRGASGGTVGNADVTAESGKSEQKGKTDFKPVTSGTTLSQSGDAVKEKDAEKSRKSWIWLGKDGRVYVMKSAAEAYWRGLAR